MKHIVAAPELDTAYEEWGSGSNIVLLLHGFPDDATAWQGVASHLPAGTRALAPYVRGVGPTRFRSAQSIRSGQLAAKVADVIAFADAVGVDRFTLVGHDWGQRTGQALAAMHPDRVRHLISFGDYALTFGEGQRPSLKQLIAFRFHLLMQTPLADPALRYGRRALFRHLWKSWSPRARFDADAFARVMPSFDNPDFVPIVLSTYRQFSGRGAADPRFAAEEHSLSVGPAITVPTTVIRATQDGLDLYDPRRPTSNKFEDLRDTIKIDAGHSPHRERPDIVGKLIATALASD